MKIYTTANLWLLIIIVSLLFVCSLCIADMANTADMSNLDSLRVALREKSHIARLKTDQHFAGSPITNRLLEINIGNLITLKDKLLYLGDGEYKGNQVDVYSANGCYKQCQRYELILLTNKNNSGAVLFIEIKGRCDE